MDNNLYMVRYSLTITPYMGHEEKPENKLVLMRGDSERQVRLAVHILEQADFYEVGGYTKPVLDFGSNGDSNTVYIESVELVQDAAAILMEYNGDNLSNIE